MSLSDTVTGRERASGNAERHRWPEMPPAGLRSPARRARRWPWRSPAGPAWRWAHRSAAVAMRRARRPGGADAEGDKRGRHRGPR